MNSVVLAIRCALVICVACLASFCPAFSQSRYPASGPLPERDRVLVMKNCDDGTEVDDSIWYEDGFEKTLNFLGQNANNKRCDVGLRFHLDGVAPGETVTFARLRLASFGSKITSSIKVRVAGVVSHDQTAFSQSERPSQKTPKTSAAVEWTIEEPWGAGSSVVPLRYSSPDLASIINEVLAVPGWGAGSQGRALILTLDATSNQNEYNYVCFDDWESTTKFRTPAVLELYRTVYDTFVGKELPARVTGRSARIHLYSLIDTDVSVMVREENGPYVDYPISCTLDNKAGEAIEISLTNLEPDTKYFYKVLCRKAGMGPYEVREERSFHTQRAPGAPFSFCIQADEHLQEMLNLPRENAGIRLYERTLGNIADGSPDFLISMGDFAHNEQPRGRDSHDAAEAVDRYLDQRAILDPVCHSVPFFLVLGNHEGEEGWHYTGSLSDLCVLSTIARKRIFPNPRPDGFYSGNDQFIPETGLREDYFSWEWGDALFVVLDMFWYSGNSSSKGWTWTLGEKQYNWLHRSLRDSTRRWKFVFVHHITSGRGGIEHAKYKVDGRPTFEWGGETDTGQYVFDTMRPGWNHKSIHDLLVDEGVSAVFHGHDHFFAKQDLDGIVYLECPRPNDRGYGMGFVLDGGYKYGDARPNSGHVEVRVDPLFVEINYVRSFLPGDGVNGQVTYSHVIR
jgi:hypothetical protein